ncbi:MAG TPA: lytic transglycosylase domain-containing protein [Terriglobales bacterium]|nr:lytic transglycosylase domain-containing protein [Terriglobales bacterium]
MSGQQARPRTDGQASVIDRWSEEVLEAADNKVRAAEETVRIMNEPDQPKSAPGNYQRGAPADQWANAYVDVLSRRADLQTERVTVSHPSTGVVPLLDLRLDRFKNRESNPSQEWVRMIGEILTREGLPAELAAVPLVESGFSPTAVSPKGAKGLWQLMPDTARHFGLRVDRILDERTDPLRATAAAVSYLKYLYATLGNWPLVLAAYNAGLGRVIGAIQKGAPDFATMAARRLLPEETLRYVPHVLGGAAPLGIAGGPETIRQE